MTNASDAKDFLEKLYFNLKQAYHDGDVAIKVEDLYGKLGMTYAFEIGPYLCWIPPLITVILVIVFRRKKLLGVTQKFILSIMVADLLYTTISSVRDTLLRVFEMHYGFLEHHICAEVVYSFRFQMICHTTSVWLKTLMSLHQVLLVGFPLKVKLYNLSAGLGCFLIFHIVFCLIFLLLLTSPTFEPVPMIQDYRIGDSMRRILGCRLAPYGLLHIPSLSTLSTLTVSISYLILMYAQAIPFVLHFISIVLLIILLTKHIRTLSVLVHNAPVERIKYVSLLKVNIGLGISFFLQELPIIFFFIYQVVLVSDHVTYDKIYSKYQGVAIAIMSISFSIGKPIDLMIYASLSQSFKQEIRKLIRFVGRAGTPIRNTIRRRRVKRNTNGNVRTLTAPSRQEATEKPSTLDQTVESAVSI